MNENNDITSKLAPAQVGQLDGQQFVTTTVHSLRELAAAGKPTTVSELKERIDAYFTFCADRKMRPGIEALSLALGVSRVSFWNWTQGKHCSAEWQECCTQAWQTVAAFLEAASTAGRLTPPVAIFLMKNWLGYRDVADFKIVSNDDRALTAEELPRFDTALARGAVSAEDRMPLPNLEGDSSEYPDLPFV